MRYCITTAIPFQNLRCHGGWEVCLELSIRLFATGLITMPTAGEAGRKEHGAHAMLMVGYSDKDQVFIVRNRCG
jgi:hypothetical protein